MWATKRLFALALSMSSAAAGVVAAEGSGARLTPVEEHRKQQLASLLCATRELDCAYVTGLFSDPRLRIYYPPAPERKKPPELQKEREQNPFFRERFGLLTTESLERCRGFLQMHAAAFDAAYQKYGVPPQIICGILRIETDFGMPTRLSPHPLGTIPVINRLVTLYVRLSPGERSFRHFVRQQEFALLELKDLLKAAAKFGWDVFEIPGSPTGAIGLAQFEPSSLKDAVDGNGDGTIDLFDPSDAIPSVAHYLVTRGWDADTRHQERAIYAYYGGNYDADPHKYYMAAVLRYAHEISEYLKDHPVESESAATHQPE